MSLLNHSTFVRRALVRKTDGRLTVTGGLGVVVGSTRHLTCKFLECLSLGLRNQKRGEDATEHEKCEDLHDVIEPWGWVCLCDVPLGSKRSKHGLSNDGANLARCSRETVRGRSVSRGETFSRHNKGRCVRTEVEEELSQDVKSQKPSFIQFVVGETDDDEEDGEHDEAHELDGFATDGIDCSDGDPVAWDGASAGDDQVANSSAAEDLVNSITFGKTNGLQDDGVVETKTVESDLLSVLADDLSTYEATLTSKKNQEPAVPRSTLPCFHVP